ncbi:hypothetical protein WN944_001016 [Citrus x changshan-huyou]|uniref:Uncharacterized protein n=1 Tax=Citrus x changshan-huyou TaxID=2935761 RepID=A0AAP0MDV5_9ROSI
MGLGFKIFLLLGLVITIVVLLTSTKVAAARNMAEASTATRKAHKFFQNLDVASAVFWSIGSRPKLEKRGNSGCWVQAYSNGNVYDGEYNKGNGDVYADEWSNGQSHGCGVHTCEDGSRLCWQI